MNDPADIDKVLSALPVRAPEAITAERVRLRARLELRTRSGADGRPGFELAVARAWYVAEPWVAGAAVVAFLGWTFERMAILLG